MILADVVLLLAMLSLLIGLFCTVGMVAIPDGWLNRAFDLGSMLFLGLTFGLAAWVVLLVIQEVA